MSNKYLKWSQATLPKRGLEKQQPPQEQKQHLYPSRAVRTEDDQGSQGLHLRQTSPSGGCKGTAINFCRLPASLPKEKSVALQLSACRCPEGFHPPGSPGPLPARTGIVHPAGARDEVTPTAPRRGCAVRSSQLPTATPWCLAGVGEEHYFIIWNAKQICFNLIQCWS